MENSNQVPTTNQEPNVEAQNVPSKKKSSISKKIFIVSIVLIVLGGVFYLFGIFYDKYFNPTSRISIGTIFSILGSFIYSTGFFGLIIGAIVYSIFKVRQRPNIEAQNVPNEPIKKQSSVTHKIIKVCLGIIVLGVIVFLIGVFSTNYFARIQNTPADMSYGAGIGILGYIIGSIGFTGLIIALIVDYVLNRINKN
jgi:heme/copper-type cytochrome/quinol oxidase subunit 2